MIITIDGPSASGKSTVAQALAQKLGFYYLNTGLLYRAVSYLLIAHEGYTLEQLAHPDTQDLMRYADHAQLQYTYGDKGDAKISFNGNDITPFLKNAQNDQAASILSRNPVVRDVLFHLQRHIAQQYDVVIDGRDSGSVVFPMAEHKFFLTALADERARRWQRMQAKRGASYTIEQAECAVQERDKRDAPIVIPEGAVVIDSTNLDMNQVIQEIMQYLK